MEKKFYFFLSLFLLLGFTTFAQFQEAAQLTDYPLVAHNSYDMFGDAVAADGDIVVVGSPNYEDKGAAYVFFNNAGSYDTLAILTSSDAALDDEFGCSVSISGDVIVVGASHADALGANSGTAYVFEKPLAGWSDMTESAILTAADVNTGDYFGISISIDNGMIGVGAYYQNNVGAVYLFDKSSGSWAESAKLTASGGSTADQFGKSVSISGDVVIVGSPGDDDGGNSSGSAYAFEKPSAGWSGTVNETAKLTASDATASDNFGVSVSISTETVAIGASGNDATYVFEKPTGSWVTATETAILTGSDAAGGEFGCSVSISNDIIAVGADYNNDNGSVYVFEKPSGSWVSATETAKLTSSDGSSMDQFGISVCISGDAIVVGAKYDDDHGQSSGSAYTFDKPSGSWASDTETAKLLPHRYNSIKYLHMGSSVAIEGDITVLGNDFDNINFVEVLEFNGNTWEKVAILKPSDGDNDDKFGFSVAINNDIIMVGSYMHAGTGAAYLFEKPTGGWEDMTETVKLVADDAAADDYFGYSVALGIGSSGCTAVVGAWNDVVGATQSGSVYVFEKFGAELTTMSQSGQLSASDLNTAIYFGYSVSIVDETIVVGSYNAHDTDSGTRPGAVYVFVNIGLAWGNDTETAKLLPSDGVSGDEFGRSVSLSGDVIVVGSPKHDAVASDAGATYIYEKPSSGWASTSAQDAKLTATDLAAGDRFGYSASISGENVIVGAYFNGSGSAYTFEKPSSGWVDATESDKLTASDGVSGDGFGTAVAISSNYILIGAPQKEVSGSSEAGSAYLFQAPLTWTGAIDSDWHTAGNWDFEITPDYYDDVFVDSTPLNQPEITAAADCYDFELDATASLKIYSDATTSGSLIINGSYTGAADMEYHRYMVGDQWHLTGSPFVDMEIADYISSSNLVNDGTNYKMKDYIESTDSWATDYTASTTGTMTSGKGYAAKNASSGTTYFQGTPNVAAVNATLTRDRNGWNLLSNPFTSAIAATVSGTDADDYLLNADNVAVLDPSFAALYLWVEDIADPTNVDNYKVINNAASGSLIQDYLQTGQGFMVKSKTGGGSFDMTPAMQSHQISTAFKATPNTDWTGITLIAENDDAKTSTHIAYQENMTRGLDVSYDAGLLGANPSFSLYSKLVDDNGVDFMVQCLPTSYEDLVVPIGLDAEAGSEITFRADVSNLPKDYVAVLEDREKGIFTAFETEASAYTVTLDNASTGTGRFYLRTSFKSSVGVSDLGQSNFSVFAQSSSQTLIINGRVEENTIANVYDIRGKLVKSFDLQLGTQNRLMFNEQSGVYIIQISDSKGIVSEKVNWVK